MLYYRVKPEADQKRRNDGSIYIASELYTPTEAKKYKLNFEYLEAVTISRKQTYFCFGARFSN